MTTCSTSSTSTSCRVSTANSTDETPGLSGPVVVIRTGVWVTGHPSFGDAARSVCRSGRGHKKSACPASQKPGPRSLDRVLLGRVLLARVVPGVVTRDHRFGEHLRRRRVAVDLLLPEEADLALVVEALDHVRVVQLERRAL